MFITATKNSMLDSQTINLMSLHTDDPGASGTANEVSGTGPSGTYARKACTFAAAASSTRALSADVDFVGPANTPADTDNLWVGLWDSSGPTFKGSIKLTGDTSLNASGEFRVNASGTNLLLTDPA